MRRLAGVLAVLCSCAAAAPDARAAGTCVYDAPTKTVTATPDASGDTYLIVSPSGALSFDGASCGAATTANTTAMNVDASGRRVSVQLGAPVTTTLITITNTSVLFDVIDATGSDDHWTAGELADRRQVVDLDDDGVAEIISSSSSVVLDGRGGADVLSGAGGIKGPADEIAGPVEPYADVIGGLGADTLTGPGELRSGPGDDTIIQGPSYTSLRYLEGPQGVRMKADLSGTETGGDGNGGTDTYIGFTGSTMGLRVIGSQHADVLYGGPGDDNLGGHEGDDQMHGLGGADFVQGMAGADTVSGGEGNDIVAGFYEHDSVDGPDAPNIVRSGPGTDRVYGGSSGDDFGPLADDEADEVWCHGGTDTGTADRVDTLANCEFAAPVVSYAPTSGTLDEGGAAQFALTLSYPLDFAASVDVLTLEGTATSGADYTPIARRVTFAPGETTATVDVSALADDEDEVAETLTLALANPSNAPALGSNASVTITDKSAPVTTVVVGREAGTGTGGIHLAPPTVTVSTPASATEVRCVLDPATKPATFADIPAGACPFTGAGQTATADGTHTLCAASTSTTTGDTSPVACATWTTDATPPAVDCTPSSFKVGDRGKVVRASVVDATSGPVTVSLSAAADTATSGEKTATFVARDKAGNATTVKCAYSVSSVALCGQPLVLLSVQPAGRRVRLGGLAAPAYAGKTVTVRASGKPVGTATVARDGSFSVVVKAPRRAGARYQATLPDGGSTPAHKLARSLVITKRSGTTVHGRIVARKDLRPRRVSFYRQDTCTNQRAFATAKVSKSGAFKIKLAGPVAPERIALYRVKARIGKASRYTSYTLPIVVKGPS